MPTSLIPNGCHWPCSLDRSTPACLYRDLYSARGQDENFIKMLKNDWASDRTSDRRFLANHLRLCFAGAAYVLHQALRTEVLVHTELAKAQPLTVIRKLFKLAMRAVAFQDRIKLHLPTSCPVHPDAERERRDPGRGRPAGNDHVHFRRHPHRPRWRRRSGLRHCHG